MTEASVGNELHRLGEVVDVRGRLGNLNEYHACTRNWLGNVKRLIKPESSLRLEDENAGATSLMQVNRVDSGLRNHTADMRRRMSKK